MWPDKRMKLNLDYCARIFDMVFKSFGWSIDGCAPNDEEHHKVTVN